MIHSVKSVHLLVILPWHYVLTFMLVNKGIIWILYLSWLNTPETRPIPGLPFMSCCFTAQCCSTNDSLLVGYCYYTDIPQDVQKQDMIWFYLMSWYCIQFKLSLWWRAVTWNVNFRNSQGDQLLSVVHLWFKRQHGGNSRFPRIEDMPHFHYDFVDLGEQVKVSWNMISIFLCLGVELLHKYIHELWKLLSQFLHHWLCSKSGHGFSWLLDHRRFHQLNQT